MGRTVAIEAQGVDVSFPARRGEPVRALSGLDLAVGRGTVFCLLGPNGSGKTTVINVLNGLLAPTSGTATVLGLDPQRQRRELLSRIALAPQETALYEQLTGRENLRFHAHYYGVAADRHERRIREMLQLVSLEESADARVSSYSGGMRRRLMLGRALLTDPELIFLDEPTLGVDVQSRHAIWQRIDALADEGRTIFLTTNYMEEADHLGRHIMILDQGRTVAAGTPSQLRQGLPVAQLELRFDTVDASRAAAATLESHHSYERRARSVIIEPGPGTDTTDLLATVLQGLGTRARPTHVQLGEPTLQDVFLHHTGDALRD